MKTFHPPRVKWPLWLGCAGCLGLELVLFAGITRHAMSAARASMPPPGAWSWASIAGWHLFIAALGALLLWEPFVQLRIRFDEEGISRPRFLRPSIYIKWAEVETLLAMQSRHQFSVLKINTHGESIEINTLFYRQPDHLISFVEERVKSCLPEFCR